MNSTQVAEDRIESKILPGEVEDTTPVVTEPTRYQISNQIRRSREDGNNQKKREKAC